MSDLVVQQTWDAKQAIDELKRLRKEIKDGEGAANGLQIKMKLLKAQMLTASDTAEYKRLASDLRVAESQMDALNRAAGRTTSGFKDFGRNLKDIKQAFSILSGAAVLGLVTSRMGQIVTFAQKFHGEAKEAADDFERLGKFLQNSFGESSGFGKAMSIGLEYVKQLMALYGGIATFTDPREVYKKITEGMAGQKTDEEIKKAEEQKKLDEEAAKKRIENEIKYQQALNKRASIIADLNKEVLKEREAQEARGLDLLDQINEDNERETKAKLKAENDRAKLISDLQKQVMADRIAQEERGLDLLDQINEEREARLEESAKRSTDRMQAIFGGFSRDISNTLYDAFNGKFSSIQKAFAQTLKRMAADLIGSGILSAISSAVGGKPVGLFSQIFGKLFDSGGYTGRGGKYEPAGIVHKGEVVWSQSDVQQFGGVDAVEAIRPTARQQKSTGGHYFGGGEVVPMQAPRTNSNPINVTLMLDKHELGRAWFEPNGVLQSINRSRGNPE